MFKDYMLEALNEARKAYSLDEVPIGCVIVKDDSIIARGYNVRETAKNALGHAEIIAINNACRALNGWRLLGCDLYVTLEPCSMCAGAAVNARIERIIFGAYDPKAGACGSVFNIANAPELNHRIEVIPGIMGEECSEILKSFFRKKRNK